MSPAPALRVWPLDALPEVRPGDDLAALIVAAGADGLPPGAAVVVSHKVVSKAEGAIVRLADVTPGPDARALAGRLERDPRLMQVVLDQSATVVRAERGVLICRTHHGLVAAHAGVDQSNVTDGWCVTLPRDPDASARRLRAALPGRPAVVIADSFGRPWRHGQAEVAIGCAGIVPIDDQRGGTDRDGRELVATQIAIADQVAAAADLVRGKTSGQPAVVVEGLDRWITDEDGPGAVELRRGADEDLFGPRG
ncbi:MAG: coenzyme F420-0:L-glutamate ligase [Solirubrobacteraceae bacterium]